MSQTYIKISRRFFLSISLSARETIFSTNYVHKLRNNKIKTLPLVLLVLLNKTKRDTSQPNSDTG